MTVKEITEKIVNCNYRVISHWHTNIDYPVDNVLDKKVLAVTTKKGEIIISI